MKNQYRKLSIILLVILALFLTVGCLSRSNFDRDQKLPEGWTESSIQSGGLTRWYRIYLPDPMPDDPSIVFYLHGGTLSMRSIFSPLADSTTTWLRLAEEEGLVLIVPNGVDPETGDTYGNNQNWNDLRDDPAEGQHQVDDVEFLVTLLEQTLSDLDLIQPTVYVTGASNGGMMTYRLLKEAPGYFSAGAAYIANHADPGAGQPILEIPTPIMIANGTLDPLVPWDGGVVGKDRGLVLSTAETVEWWITANQADPDRVQKSRLPDINPDDRCQIELEYFPPMAGGAPVYFYTFQGGGHTLPTLTEPGWFEKLTARILGPVCHDVDGILLAWEFFKEVSPND